MKEEILLTLVNYCMKKHGPEIRSYFDQLAKEFPYDYEGLGGELYIKSFIEWLILETPLPDSGKRVIEEYVEDHSDLPTDEKERILGMKNVIASEFVVIAKDQHMLYLKDTFSELRYRVHAFSKISQMGVNSLVKGRIFPYGDEYRFVGAFLISNSPMIRDPEVIRYAFEEDQIKNAESIIVSQNSKLTSVLNKYPAHWVDGICEALSIAPPRLKGEKVKAVARRIESHGGLIYANLPEKSKEALHRILKNDGWIRYHELKGFSDAISFWWNEDPPTSDLGILRLHGLIAVGKMPADGRLLKVAIIPKDVKENLKMN